MDRIGPICGCMFAAAAITTDLVGYHRWAPDSWPRGAHAVIDNHGAGDCLHFTFAGDWGREPG